MIKNQNQIIFHPGYYVKEFLDETEMSQCELTKELNVTERTVNQLVNEKLDLTDSLINKLSSVLGTSKTLWKNLNTQYLKDQSKIKNSH
ncbi:transcriptional regulator [Lentilactobacillus raoultii]|uniref:Transcriptional regulator n=1 Tax=Lentilactobacillus raoultii TaxID=1987503 RepID=A0ABW3PHZ8_9LACO|nr:hypothetical protein [Lentilactobacillus raoultii]